MVVLCCKQGWICQCWMSVVTYLHNLFPVHCKELYYGDIVHTKGAVVAYMKRILDDITTVVLFAAASPLTV